MNEIIQLLKYCQQLTKKNQQKIEIIEFEYQALQKYMTKYLKEGE
jgi:hypothetical protein